MTSKKICTIFFLLLNGSLFAQKEPQKSYEIINYLVLYKRSPNPYGTVVIDTFKEKLVFDRINKIMKCVNSHMDTMNLGHYSYNKKNFSLINIDKDTVKIFSLQKQVNTIYKNGTCVFYNSYLLKNANTEYSHDTLINGKTYYVFVQKYKWNIAIDCRGYNGIIITNQQFIPIYCLIKLKYPYEEILIQMN